MPCHVTSHHVMSCHVLPCHVVPCHVMSCHAMSRHVMSRHVTSCHVTGGVMSFFFSLGSDPRTIKCYGQGPTLGRGNDEIGM